MSTNAWTRPLRVLRALALASGLVAVFAGSAVAAPTWLPAQNLSIPPTTGTPGGSKVASDAIGESFATWFRTDGTNTRVQLASHGPGLPWSAAGDLSPAGQDANPPGLSLSGTGFGAIAWAESDGAHVVVMVSRRAPGGAFGAPETISSTSIDAAGTAPAVAVDAAGDVVVAWTDASNLALHARRFTASSGTWGTIIDLATAPVNQVVIQPTLVISASGVATAAWLFDSDSTSGATFELQTRTQGTNGVWDAMTPLTALATPDEAGGQQLAVDAAGNVTLVWFQYQPMSPSYSHGVVFESTLAATPGAVWQSPQTLSDPLLISDSPEVAATPAGEVTVAWTEAESESVKVVTRPPGGTFPAASAATTITPNDKQIQSGFMLFPFTSLHVVANANETVVTFARSDGTNFLEEAVSRPAGAPWPDPATHPPTVLSQPGSDVASVGSSLASDGLGNVVATWVRGNVIQAAAFAVSGPAVVALAVPPTATTGQPVSMAAATVDVWSGLAPGQPTWSFGDTNLGVGPTVSHVYAAPGTYTVSVVATDAVGNAGGPATHQIVVTNPPIPPIPATTIARPKLKALWKSNKLVGSVALSGTVGLSTVLTAKVKLHGGTKTSISSRCGTKLGAWSRTLKLPSGLAPGRYDVTVSGNGVSSATTSFTLVAPASGIIKRSYATGPRKGPAVTALGKTSELWAHFQFRTVPKKGQKITTQWILPSGRKLSANTRPRTTLVEAQVKDLAGKNLPPGRWRCVIRVGKIVLVTLNVRLK
jgi:PKD domain